MHILKIPGKQSLNYIVHKQSLENDFFFSSTISESIKSLTNLFLKIGVLFYFFPLPLSELAWKNVAVT